MLRLLAAFGVLFSHHFALVDRPEPQVPGFGSIGVFSLTIFFVISGYFIASSWARTPDPFAYWRKRLLRIFPALVAVIAGSILVIGPIETNLSLQDYAANPMTWGYWKNTVLVLGIQKNLPGVFVANAISTVNVPLWSLPAELFMYSIVFISGITLTRITRWAYPALAIAFAIGFLLLPGAESGVLPLTLNIGVYFFLGASVYSFRLLERISPRILLASTLLVLFAMTLGGSSTKPLLWVAVPIVVLGLGARPSRLGAAISDFGDISYGVYLWAFPIQQLMIARLYDVAGFWTTMLLSVVLTATLAVGSWFWIERPALTLKNTKRSHPRSVTVTSALARE